MLYRRIRDLREDRDLTQREPGEILLCSQRVCSDYERGVLDIPTEILKVRGVEQTTKPPLKNAKYKRDTRHFRVSRLFFASCVFAFRGYAVRAT